MRLPSAFHPFLSVSFVNNGSEEEHFVSASRLAAVVGDCFTCQQARKDRNLIGSDPRDVYGKAVILSDVRPFRLRRLHGAVHWLRRRTVLRDRIALLEGGSDSVRNARAAAYCFLDLLHMAFVIDRPHFTPLLEHFRRRANG